MTQFTVTPSSNNHANSSSSTRAAARTQQQRSKTPRYLSYLRTLVTLSMSAMLTAGAAAGGTLTRNLAGGRYFMLELGAGAVDVSSGGKVRVTTSGRAR